ncbi:MAG: glycoside hydrolase family 43 protein [Christensenellales bacterium]|jgi:arabinan endo-1,5-alpha-L-arabinosidase
MKTNDIQMRDPYVVLHQGKYYMTGTTDKNAWIGPFVGFDVYESDDMENWSGPFPAFRAGSGFFADRNFWAPEIHEYKGEFYLFASFKADDIRRGTAVLKSQSSSPKGPYTLHSDGNITPSDWECLDGTLHVDEIGAPWMVFCHEWVQEGGGTICALPLSPDLKSATGEAVTLFAASDTLWPKQITHSTGISGHVTDGPSIFKPKSGGLWMLWSSMTDSGYGIGLSISESGNIMGPWKHQEQALFSADGGHGMVFADKTGQLYLTIHTPNKTPNERPIFLKLKETAEGFSII